MEENSMVQEINPNEPKKVKAKRGSYQTERMKDTIFYISLLWLPVLNFVIFKCYRDYLDAILFVFKRYDFDSGSFIFSSDLFYNFKILFAQFENPKWGQAVLVTLKNYAWGWVWSTPMSFIVPYYIVKKYLGTKIFKFVLMLPGMVSSMVWMMLYTTFVEVGLTNSLGWEIGPLANPDTVWWTMTLQGMWLGVSGSMLLYTGIMSGVSSEVVDAGKIDGLNAIGEMWHIYIPVIYPIWYIGVVGGVIGLFKSGGGGSLYEYFGYNAGPEVRTVGYILWCEVMSGDGMDSYGINCAGSLFFAVCLMPLALFLKWILENRGPTTEERVNKKLLKAEKRRIANNG